MFDESAKKDKLAEEVKSAENKTVEVPDPNGPPLPVRQRFTVDGCLVRVIAGGGLFMLISNTMMPTVGATRSARLEWQQRRELIEMALRDERQREALDAGTISSAVDDE